MTACLQRVVSGLYPMSTPMERRHFLLTAGVAAVAAASGGGDAMSQASANHSTRQPDALPAPGANTSDILVDTLIAWGATHVFGIVGDGINPLIEALRKRRDRITYIGVRHEESAAWMASGMAKHAGRLGVCIGTTGPGAVHLLNGLYDASLDGSAVVAITGTTFHDLEGMHFMQSVNTVKLMEDVALYNERINGPAHALFVANRACRIALGQRGVAHLTITKDDQVKRLADDRPSMENHGGRTSSSWSIPAGSPPLDQLQLAAAVLNAGRKIAVLAGQGCKGARGELESFAQILGAPIAKAYLGKSVLPDDHPHTTGGIGHLGTAPSSWAMHECDTVVILGSTMPWIDYYPKPGQARGVQIDLRPERIGLRYPVEVGLTGDIKATLAALQPLLKHKTDRTFLLEAQARMVAWNTLLANIAATPKSGKIRPQTALQILSELAPPTAMYSMDCGANTHFAARTIQIRDGQSFTGSGTLVSMASALPLAIAGALAYPGRMSIAVAGDGGFAMLMAELSTAVLHALNVKVMVLNNDALAQVKFEQKEIGSEEYGCALGHIDFAAFSDAVGARGFRVAGVADLRSAIHAWLATPGPALLDVMVDPDEKPRVPAEESV
jgi:pyruvate dehydrogenase (quinone)